VSGCRQHHALSQEDGNDGYSVSQIRFTERSRTATAAPASYWLLLAFLFLLYANLPMVMSALDPLHLAKVVGGVALVMLIASESSRKRVSNWRPPRILPARLSGRGGAVFSDGALAPSGGRCRIRPCEMSIVFFFIVNCANTGRRLRGVMWTMVIGGLLPAAGTLRNYLQGNLVEGRAAWVGIFANPNELAYSLVILLPLVAFLAVGLGLVPRLALLGLHSSTWRRSWSLSRVAEWWGWW